MNILLVILTRYLLFRNSAIHIFVNFTASVHILISKRPAPSYVHFKLDYCNSLCYNLPEY